MPLAQFRKSRGQSADLNMKVLAGSTSGGDATEDQEEALPGLRLFLGSALSPKCLAAGCLPRQCCVRGSFEDSAVHIHCSSLVFFSFSLLLSIKKRAGSGAGHKRQGGWSRWLVKADTEACGRTTTVQSSQWSENCNLFVQHPETPAVNWSSVDHQVAAAGGSASQVGG